MQQSVRCQHLRTRSVSIHNVRMSNVVTRNWGMNKGGNVRKGKGKGKVHPRTDHEGPEGE